MHLRKKSHVFNHGLSKVIKESEEILRRTYWPLLSRIKSSLDELRTTGLNHRLVLLLEELKRRHETIASCIKPLISQRTFGVAHLLDGCAKHVAQPGIEIAIGHHKMLSKKFGKAITL